jgi:hypothetical protein
MKTELVFNLDEIRMSEREDGEEKKAIFGTMMDSEMIYHGAPSILNDISVIA